VKSGSIFRCLLFGADCMRRCFSDAADEAAASVCFRAQLAEFAGRGGISGVPAGL
jgi:hypothetical protein